MEFKVFKDAVGNKFNTMKTGPLFRTAVTKDELWACYLGSFPEGTDPMFRERTEHDCNCCKQFIRVAGNMVSIVDGKTVSLWDCKVADPTYQIVADAMAALVKSRPIEIPFLHTERTAGTDKNFEDTVNGVSTWEHFFINIPWGGTRGERNFVARGVDIGPALSEARARHDVLIRSLTEITFDSIDTVLDLISQNSLHRGAEHKRLVVNFKEVKKRFDMTPVEDQDNFVWLETATCSGSLAKMRNTVIGTLLSALSTGVELKDAVASFEDKVSGGNYKRPKSLALVSKKMIEDAGKKIEEMGLTSALERRYANIGDITVNNVLFADREAKQSMAGGSIFDQLAKGVPDKKPNLDRVEEVHIDKFLSDILPTATSIEVMVENAHEKNLFSLIAPVDPTAGQLFKWPNPFSWSYNGDVADSVAERVKQAGGNIVGELCCRLAWYNFDDLDIHMVEPDRHEIFYGSRGPSPSGGRLDVDMNRTANHSRKAVENIYYNSCSKMKEGTYKLMVHNFRLREHTDVGFEVEIDYKGTIHKFSYDKEVRDGQRITVAEFKYSHAKGIEIIKSIPGTETPKTMWGIKTGNFHKVDAITLSPNYWDGVGSGNKHYMFMVNGCINDGTARGFYNEFLKPEFDANRKVFEIVGSKMRTEGSDRQLSGLGFPSTQRASLLCKVTGSFTRMIKIVF